MNIQTPMLAVVMPVYNEKDIIKTVINQWVSVLELLGIDYVIHVYNDGSCDGTDSVLDSIANCYNRMIVHHQKNKGHGATILRSYKENINAEWIFQTDSDNEMDISAFADLWKRRDEYDLLLGRRSSRSCAASRRIISAVSRVTVRLLYGPGVYDSNAPFRLMRTRCFADFFTMIPPDAFAPNVIISGIAAWQKMRIYEQPVTYHSRVTGEVSIKHMKLLLAAVKSLLQTVMFFLRYRIDASYCKRK